MTLMQRRRALMGAGQGGNYEHGTWEDLFYHLDKGDYATSYALGEVLPLDLGAQGVINAQIVAFDADTKTADGKARVSFVSQYLTASSHSYNPALAGSEGNYDLGTGGVGGWGYSELRNWVRDTIKPLIPPAIRGRIVEVAKTTKGALVNGSMDGYLRSYDEVWVPSMREIYGTQDGGNKTVTYSTVVDRMRSKPGGANIEYGLRSASSTSARYAISGSGSSNGRAVTNAYPVLIGFCID